MKKLLLLLCCLSLFACAKPTETNSVVTREFALELVETRVNVDDVRQLELLKIVDTLNSQELSTLKSYIKEIMNQKPPITTSIAMTWRMFGLVYQIDEKLDTLEYTKVVEGYFGEFLGSLVGTAEFYFLTDSGEKFVILETAATLFPLAPDKVLFNSSQKIRLYIKQYSIYNKMRNEVVKIEIIK